MAFWELTARWFLWIGTNALLFLSTHRLCRFRMGLEGAELWASVGVVVLGCLTAVETLLGAVGRFDFVSVAVALCALSIILQVGSVRGSTGTVTSRQGMVGEPFLPRGQFRVFWLFLLATTIAHVGSRLALALRDPPSNWDSLWYHLPTAVEWIKARSLWTESRPPYWYFPHNGELFLSWLLMPFHSDLLANLYNFPVLLWLCCAAWSLADSLGIPRGWRWVPVCAIPHLGAMHSALGTQKNDLLLATLYLSALAFLMALHRFQDKAKARLLLAMLAGGGLLVGIKLNGIPYSVFVLFLGGMVTWAVPRLRKFLPWGLACYAAGGVLGIFWFFRNRFLTGQFLLVADPQTIQTSSESNPLGSSLLMTVRSFSQLRPLAEDFLHGAGWLAAGGLAAAFILLAWIPAPEKALRRRVRWMAGLSLASFVAFLATPWTGLVLSGHEVVRLGLPGVLLSMLCLVAWVHPLAARWPGSIRPLLYVALSALAVVPSGDPAELVYRVFMSPRGKAGVILFILGPPAAALWSQHRSTVARWALGVALLAIAASPVFLWELRNFRWNRWSTAYALNWKLQGEESGLFRWAEKTRGAKIALYGLQIYYPFYGPRWENELCLDRGRYDDPQKWLQHLRREGVREVLFHKYHETQGLAADQKTVWPQEREWILKDLPAFFQLEYRDRISEVWRLGRALLVSMEASR